MINAARCDAENVSGCRVLATVGVGKNPLDAVFTINIARCNATDTTGCSRPATAQAVGSQPNGLAIDDDTSTVYAFTGPGPGAASIFEGPL